MDRRRGTRTLQMCGRRSQPRHLYYAFGILLASMVAVFTVPSVAGSSSGWTRLAVGVFFSVAGCLGILDWRGATSHADHPLVGTSTLLTRLAAYKDPPLLRRATQALGAVSVTFGVVLVLSAVVRFR